MKHVRSYFKGHPNPQFFRENFLSLNGEWDFCYDENDEGIDKEYFKSFPEEHLSINVPYPYQAKLSGIGEDKKHVNVVWYHKSIHLDKLDEHIKITFLGVDYLTFVYVNGKKVITHEGAYDSFSIDIRPYVHEGENDIVLRCYDPMRIDQIRGKQRWRDNTFECFYTETTGVFKDIYLEKLDKIYLDNFSLKAVGNEKTLYLKGELNRVIEGLKLGIKVYFKDELIKDEKIEISQKYLSFAGFFENISFWNYDNPNLYDLEITIFDDEKVYDKVLSYFGFSDVKAENRKVYINDKETYLKLILDQGYFPLTITSPTEEQIIKDIEIIKNYGFNGMRKHEKIESPLYYYYLDLLGLYVWQECPSPHAYSYDSAVQVKKQIVRQIKDHISHPSIISYVIYNESWGIQGIDRSKEIQDVTVDLYHTVKELVKDRFVISNDGWEHTKSDLITVHNYSSYEKDLEENLTPGIEAILKGENGKVSKNFKDIFAGDYRYEGQPLLFTEFAGIAFSSKEGNWGYGDSVKTKEDWIERYSSQLNYIKKHKEFVGFCFTQTTDVEIEVNGLVDFERNPKIDFKTIKELHDKF